MTLPNREFIMASITRRLVTYKELREFGIPWSRAHLQRLEDAGEFPQRIPLGRNRVVWEVVAIEEYIETRKRKLAASTKRL
jgi:prophage regulatory protein